MSLSEGRSVFPWKFVEEVVAEVKRVAMRPVRGLKIRAAPMNSFISLTQS